MYENVTETIRLGLKCIFWSIDDGDADDENDQKNEDG